MEHHSRRPGVWTLMTVGTRPPYRPQTSASLLLPFALGGRRGGAIKGWAEVRWGGETRVMTPQWNWRCGFRGLVPLRFGIAADENCDVSVTRTHCQQSVPPWEASRAAGIWSPRRRRRRGPLPCRTDLWLLATRSHLLLHSYPKCWECCLRCQWVCMQIPHLVSQ